MPIKHLRSPASRRSVLIGALGGGALMLTGCSDTHAGASTLPRTSVTLYGDSITTGIGTNAIHAETTENPNSWPHHFDSSTARLADITAINGITAEGILPQAQPAHTDVLLLELGANDLNAVNEGKTLDEMLAWMQKSVLLLVKATEKSGRDVIMTAIGPRPAAQRPEYTDRFNSAMKAWSEAQKFWWIDPWPDLKGSELGAYKDGTSDDGEHPNAIGAVILGAAYGAEVDRVLKARAGA